MKALSPIEFIAMPRGFGTLAFSFGAERFPRDERFAVSV
jgi:hypothetical protein